MKFKHYITPCTQAVNSTYKRRLEDTQHIFWTSFVRPFYMLYPRVKYLILLHAPLSPPTHN